MKLGLFGYGTIGRGVYTLVDNLKEKYNLELKRVFDLPNKKEILGDKLVTDINDIINDDEIETVVEALGGHDLPYQVISGALNKGKNVITSNKEVVSAHLEEFLSTAHKNNCSFLFEASVGGGIPIIRSLIDNSKINEINDIFGILNGTTNYILTKMSDENLSFEDALALAKKNGFAEANPTADLEGLDGVRKINILSSLAFQGNISNDDIYHYGITGVNKAILDDIKARGYVLKFVASSHRDGNDVTIRVEPTMVPQGHPLSAVKNEFNSIMFTGSTNDDLSFYGKGAGSIPTASAIIADLVAIVEGRGYIEYSNKNKLNVNTKKVNTGNYYIVHQTNDAEIVSDVSNESLEAAKFYARVL
ncbi:MAG: homoserine dehydrogenase [Acholeplasmatales bacterium]|nr:homoserine dehydrogenase [Acholeplasmatales bacterium]